MTIVKALVAARSQMAAIVADETAKIATTKGGEYRFKYASLNQIIETVTGALLANGVLLVQDVGTYMEKPTLVGVTTRLVHEDSTLKTDTLWFATDGSPKDIGMKVTTARRIQLMSMLGLAMDDDDNTATPNTSRAQAPVQSRSNPEPPPPDDLWETQADHRKAVGLSNTAKASRKLSLLMQRIRQDDSKQAEPMPVTPAEGKTISMYDYLCNQVPFRPAVVLSYLYGRVIGQQTPPTLNTRWLIDELRAGTLVDEVAEVTEATQITRGIA